MTALTPPATEPMVNDAVVTEDGAGPLRWVTINRPAVHNALNRPVFDALDEVCTRAVSDPDLRVLFITGAGAKAFSAGADLDELAGRDADAALAILARGRAVLDRITRLPVPVVAAVNGVALGGGFELALACTFVIAADNAAFGLPETGLGLMPGYGGTQRLPRAVGRATALRLMLTGDRLGAAEAHTAGLLAAPPVPPSDLRAVCEAVGDRIAARGPRATTRVLDAVRAGDGPPAGLDHELLLASMAIGSAEAAEGIAAFRERRSPSFAGGDT
ncbi:MAG TPA: enoyl-CoA hydratase/isomerase family protein [Acidimicrobiia bacterium]|nr:enoyl-CoA hydratase/isomerase family protein [Acidimicrobiia bacterium]